MHKICISSHALGIKCQITERVTGDSRTVGPQYGTCFISLFGAWNLEVASRFLDNFWTPVISDSVLKLNCRDFG
jgi:hypothetical protein